MSSTQVTDTSKGYSLAFRIIKGKIFDALKPFKLSVQISTKGYTWESKPGNTEKKAVIWGESCSFELPDLRSITVSLIQHRFILPSCVYGQFSIPEDSLLSKVTRWCDFFNEGTKVGKILIAFIVEEQESPANPYHFIELERLETKYRIRRQKHKIKKLNEHQKAYRKHVVKRFEKGILKGLNNTWKERKQIRKQIELYACLRDENKRRRDLKLNMIMDQLLEEIHDNVNSFKREKEIFLREKQEFYKNIHIN